MPTEKPLNNGLSIRIRLRPDSTALFDAESTALFDELFDAYSTPIRRLFDAYSTPILRLFDGYSTAYSTAYSTPIRRLFDYFVV